MADQHSPHPSQVSLGDRVRELRQRLGMSQARLAAPGLSDSYISLIESGGRAPSPTVVEVLAGRLGCSAAYLRSGVDETTQARLKTGLRQANRALDEGRPERALATMRRLATSEGLSALPDLHIQVQHTTATALEGCGRFSEAIDVLHQLLDTTMEGPGRLSWAQWAGLQVDLARCHRRSGHHDQAARTAGAAFTIAGTAADTDPTTNTDAAQAAVQIGAVLLDTFTDRGDLLQARQTCQRMLMWAETHGHAPTRILAYRHAVTLADLTGDLEEATSWAQRALALLADHEQVRATDELRAHYAALLLRGDPAHAPQARALLSGQVARARVTGTHAEVLTDLAEAALLLGDPTQAAEYARQALQTSTATQTNPQAACDGSDRPGGQAWDRVLPRALHILGQASTALGDHSEALTALTSRAELLEQRGPSRQAAQAWLDIAHLPPPAARPHLGTDANDKSTEGPTTNAGETTAQTECTTRPAQCYRRALQAMGLHP